MGGALLEPGRLAATRRESAARDSAATATAAEFSPPELQDLLVSAVQELARATGAARVAAWARRDDGSPFVAASALRGAQPLHSAETSALEAIWERGEATDLGLPGLPPALNALAGHHGFSAAAPLFSGSGEPLAVLLLGDDRDPAGQVRPRTLAELDAAIRRLKAPATTVESLRRLSRLDQHVQRLDRLATLGELVSETVHELRNPLVSFKTFVELSAERATDPEFLNEYRSLVADELRRMERLLDELLRHAQPAPDPGDSRSGGSAEITPALESLRQLLGQRSRQRQVTLEVRNDVEAIGELRATGLTPDALRQVLLNLCLNAIDATPAGSAVVISAHYDGSQVVLCVDDQGDGVPPDRRDTIFEPFVSTRTERPGGLGLAISRKLVDEAGGHIEVVDAPGGGARFRVSLPAVVGEPGDERPEPASQS